MIFLKDETEQINSLLCVVAQALEPEPDETVSEWADKNVVLPSFSAEPGPYRTDRTPFAKGIMDALSPFHEARKVVLMKCTQISGTQIGNNWLGYIIHRTPSPVLMVQPTIEFARRVSRQRIAPLLSDSPVLRGKVRDARERDSGNTILQKEFKGGVLVLTGASSGTGLRFMAARYLILEEVDGWPHDVDNEGPPLQIVEERVGTYQDYKIFINSTPALAETSVIEPEFEGSNKQRFHVPCFYCEHFQPLFWDGLIWPEGKPEDAKYKCSNCERLIDEHFKTFMFERGRWIAEKPEVKEVYGFHLNALYSPFGWTKNSWGNLAKTWVKINRKKDPGQIQAFVNLKLGETFSEKGEGFDPSEIMDRRETYKAQVPEGVLILTAAVDMQDDRLELEVIGWGEGLESWSIDYQVFWGSPSLWEPWDQVIEYLDTTFLNANKIPFRIRKVAVDTAGHFTKQAYEFIKKCRKVHRRERVFAVKGAITPGLPIVGRSSRNNIGGINLYPIGTDTAKNEIFAFLEITEDGPGKIHFPDYPQYDDEYFLQLTSERRKPVYKKGVVVGYRYQKTRARNEALDLRVMNTAALAMLRPNWEVEKKKLEQFRGDAEEPEGDEMDSPTPEKVFIKNPKRPGGWLTGWRG